jgi:hypothetical protein
MSSCRVEELEADLKRCLLFLVHNVEMSFLMGLLRLLYIPSRPR